AIQSLGAAISWQLDAKGVAFRTQLIVNWALLVVSALLMIYLSFRIKEQGDDSANMSDEEDLKDQVETA
ncbi:hypothetical protein FBU59_004464, partial [Linderina macrospora]